MADAMIGRNAYAYLNGAAIVHLRGFDYTQQAGFIDVDPDIGSTRIVSVAGFPKDTGTLRFNLTNDEFATMVDAVNAGAAVPLYMYPSSTHATNKFYLYGNVVLSDLNFTNDLTATVQGSVAWQNSDSTGIRRQNRA